MASNATLIVAGLVADVVPSEGVAVSQEPPVMEVWNRTAVEVLVSTRTLCTPDPERVAPMKKIPEGLGWGIAVGCAGSRTTLIELGAFWVFGASTRIMA